MEYTTWNEYINPKHKGVYYVYYMNEELTQKRRITEGKYIERVVYNNFSLYIWLNNESEPLRFLLKEKDGV